MSNDPKKSLGIGLAGFGTVGTGVWETLERNADLIFNRSDVKVDIVRIAVRDLNKVRIEGVSEDKFTTNWQDVVNDPKVNIVVELIGGTDTAFDIVAAALRAGKPVVTVIRHCLLKGGRNYSSFQISSIHPFILRQRLQVVFLSSKQSRTPLSVTASNRWLASLTAHPITY